jgi:predicted methyltransferase
MRRPLPTRLAGAACLLLALGCSDLKRWAYEDFGLRDRWQEPQRVVASLALAPGAKVADLGSGGGYFTFRLADAVGPGGRVYAVDVDQGLLDYVRGRARRGGYAQVETVLAAPDDPRLPEAVDLVFTCNTYHHLEDRPAYFRALRGRLRPGGRVAIVEYDGTGGLFARHHFTAPEAILEEMAEAGYRLEKEHDLERQSFLVFVPAGAS